jgi:hypothetical protein
MMFYENHTTQVSAEEKQKQSLLQVGTLNSRIR